MVTRHQVKKCMLSIGLLDSIAPDEPDEVLLALKRTQEELRLQHIDVSTRMSHLHSKVSSRKDGVLP